MNQRVDVVIPTYNGLPYLKEAVTSVLDQTYKDWRLFVIDDGSPDKGATEKYFKTVKDPRITYIKRRNQGRSATRNYGISIGDSPCIAFLDADDIWYPNKLQKQLELLENKPKVGMVYGLCKVIDEHGHESGAINDLQSGDLFRYLLGGNNISGSASIVMIRREVFDKVGLFREDFSMAEDWEMWLRIARSYDIDYVPEYLAAYRVFEAGSRPKFLEKAQGLDYALPIMIEEFKLNRFEKARLAKACLGQACSLYLDGGDRKVGRRAFFKMLKYNPFAWFLLNRRLKFF